MNAVQCQRGCVYRSTPAVAVPSGAGLARACVADCGDPQQCAELRVGCTSAPPLLWLRIAT